MTKREKANYLIQSVSHALDVLDELSIHKGEMGVTQLSQKLGLHKNNIFRLLATLSLRGYVEQSITTEEYCLGPACLRLGQSYLLQNDLISRVRPVLAKLAEETGETISFARLINSEVYYPISIPSRRPVSTTARVGSSAAAKLSVVSRLLVAQLPDADLNEILDNSPNLNTVLKPQLQEMRSSGTFVDKGNAEPDVLCVAKIVRGLNNTVLGAIEITAPVYRSKQQELMPAMDKAVSTISNYYAGANSAVSLKDKIEKDIGSAQSRSNNGEARI